jgi:hypothetical protein
MVSKNLIFYRRLIDMKTTGTTSAATKRTRTSISLYDRGRDNVICVTENSETGITHLLFDNPFEMGWAKGVEELYSRIEDVFEKIIPDSIGCYINDNMYKVDISPFVGEKVDKKRRYYFEYEPGGEVEICSEWEHNEVELGSLGMSVLPRPKLRNENDKKTASVFIPMSDAGILITYRGTKFSDIIVPILDETGYVGTTSTTENLDKLGILFPELVWVTGLKKGKNNVRCTKISGQEPGYYHVSRIEDEKKSSINIRRTHNLIE